MKRLNDAELEQLNFENSEVTEMVVNPEGRAFLIRCNRADLIDGEAETSVDNVTLTIKDWSAVQARLFIDDEFKVVAAEDSQFFLTEVCELSHEGGNTMISGFSAQEGSWADYTIEGGTFEVHTN
ncbi:MAG: hypothetical protein H7249_09090 [Chitinophagaceae bacterium]|nr:hypothetical protein [Oligoflexus sp.]